MGLITARSRCINYGHGGRDLINQLRNSVTEDGAPPSRGVCHEDVSRFGNSAIRLDAVSYPRLNYFVARF